ncbi:MAG TPA: hypothetical protein VF329_00865 [Gammaproteobacteria bacterium]
MSGFGSMSFIFSESEWEWIDRRAYRLALETGQPMPFARAEAIAELRRLRSRPKAEVIELAERRPRASRRRAP